VYRRYSQTGEGNANLSQVNRNRIKNIILILLLIALAVTLIITLPVMQNQSETRSLYIQKIQAEVDEALRQTATLSRNAGADSAAILSRIRSNIYAVRMLNTVNASSGGKALLEEERLTSLQNMVDRYLTYLTTGMDTGEYQTALQVSLSELQEIARALN
jgi:hypothetical protein